VAGWRDEASRAVGSWEGELFPVTAQCRQSGLATVAAISSGVTHNTSFPLPKLVSAALGAQYAKRSYFRDKGRPSSVMRAPTQFVPVLKPRTIKAFSPTQCRVLPRGLALERPATRELWQEFPRSQPLSNLCKPWKHCAARAKRVRPSKHRWRSAACTLVVNSKPRMPLTFKISPCLSHKQRYTGYAVRTMLAGKK